MDDQNKNTASVESSKREASLNGSSNQVVCKIDIMQTLNSESPVKPNDDIGGTPNTAGKGSNSTKKGKSGVKKIPTGTTNMQDTSPSVH